MVEEFTSSGAFVVNDALVQMTNNHLPFGGVGKSGYGRFHGKAGFISFSNMKSVVETKAYNPYPINSRFPPYDDDKKAMVKRLLKYGSITYGKICTVLIVIIFLLVLALIVGLVIVPQVKD